MSLVEWCTSQGWPPEVGAFWDPYCKSALRGPASQVSAWAAIPFLGAEFQPTLTLPGGNAWLPLAFAGKVGLDKIKTGKTVVRVEQKGDVVLVGVVPTSEWAAAVNTVETLQAKSVIFAVPHYFARHVVSGLPADVVASKSAFG